MSEEIIKVLDDLGKRFGIVIDWSNENVMPYLQDLMARFIKYQSAMAIMWMAISLIVICITIFIALKLNKQISIKKEEADSWQEDDFDYFRAILWVVSGFIIIILTIIFVCNLQGLIQNIIMPELSVLDYLQNNGVIK